MADGSKPTLAGHPRRVGSDGEPEVFCADEQAAVSLDLARWQQLALDALCAEGVRGLAELALIFVEESEIAELNETYMGATGPTDVLAFPIDVADGDAGVGAGADMVGHGDRSTRAPGRVAPDLSEIPLLLGDVVICPAVAVRQAPEHAGSVDDELALLVVHGVLHVLGHDHADPEQATQMRSRELALLEAHHWHGPAPAEFRQTHAVSDGAADGAPDNGSAS